MKGTVFLKGDKITMRPPCKEDIPVFVRWMNNEELRRFLTIRKPISEHYEEEYIKKLNTQNDVFLVICNEEKDPIGTISIEINWVNRRGMLGIIIGETEDQNKGYGKDAMRTFLKYCFYTLNLHKIVLEVYAFNERAIKLYKDLGFLEEGRFRKHSFKEGKYLDLIYMGLLEEEWSRGEVSP